MKDILMETDILKHFIGKNVEVLVSGVWIEGHMQPIAKGVVTLVPTEETAVFYGPCALKADVIPNTAPINFKDKNAAIAAVTLPSPTTII